MKEDSSNIVCTVCIQVLKMHAFTCIFQAFCFKCDVKKG